MNLLSVVTDATDSATRHLLVVSTELTVFLFTTLYNEGIKESDHSLTRQEKNIIEWKAMRKYLRWKPVDISSKKGKIVIEGAKDITKNN